jgi:hypothetical protein
MFLEHVLDVNSMPLVTIDFAAVEELPVSVLVVQNEENRQLTPEHGAGYVGGVRSALRHTSIVGDPCPPYV